MRQTGFFGPSSGIDPQGRCASRIACGRLEEIVERDDTSLLDCGTGLPEGVLYSPSDKRSKTATDGATTVREYSGRPSTACPVAGR